MCVEMSILDLCSGQISLHAVTIHQNAPVPHITTHRSVRLFELFPFDKQRDFNKT